MCSTPKKRDTARDCEYLEVESGTSSPTFLERMESFSSFQPFEQTVLTETMEGEHPTPFSILHKLWCTPCRMVAGMYVSGSSECLGAAISGPIRVLANNDVPTGAAYIGLVLQPDPSWEGWKTNEKFQPHVPDSLLAVVPRNPAAESHSLSSNETDYRSDVGNGESCSRLFLEACTLRGAGR